MLVDMSDTKSWIADELKLVGSSEQSLVEYFNILGENSKPPEEIVKALKTLKR